VEANKGDLRKPSLAPPSHLPEAAGEKGAPANDYFLEPTHGRDAASRPATENPPARRSDQVATDRQRRPRVAAKPPPRGEGGSFDLPNLALLERLLNSGPTGVGFGLIFLSITAVKLDQFLGYGLAVGGLLFVSLSSLPRLIAELPSIKRKQPPDDTMHAKRLPRKLLFGLAITLTAGTFFLYSEATAPAVIKLTQIIGRPFDRCPIDMPLEQYIKCKQNLGVKE
jgi:hypothetical protein